MPLGSGRKTAPEWLEVSRIPTDKNKVKCDHCGIEISSKVERVRTHLSKCPKRRVTCNPVQFQENASTSGLETLPTSSAIHCEKQDSNGDSAPLFKRQKLLSDFAIKTTNHQKSDLDLKVAKFFYANNIAFNAASSNEYKEMMKALRPGYSGPSSADLSGKLLEEASTEVDDTIKKEIQDQGNSFTLLLDGWTNVKNEAVICTSVHTGKTTFFLNATDCESNKKTAEYCAEIATESIDYCQKKFGIKIFAVCSDNEKKMVKMREILEETHENIITYGCSAHYMNLLVNEISNKKILGYVTEVNKFFRNHHQPHGWLKEKGGLMPQIPNATRWNSQLDCIDTFSRNYSKYVEIQQENCSEFPENITRILENVLIYKDVIHMQKQMKYIGKIFDCMQADNTNISDSVELWLDLMECVDLKMHRDNIQKRMHQAVLPIHYLANMMNPKYAGKRLSPEQEREAESWLGSKHPEWLVPFLAFKIQDRQIYPSSMFVDDVIKSFSPAQWWNILGKRSTNENVKAFCKFLNGLCSCPANSASLERVLSTCGLVWSKLRNRLGCEKVQKLVKVHRFLNNKQELNEYEDE